jgi:hypothetical protein
MSATWTCICGKTFRVSTYHAKLVTCPLCYFVLGEAVPLRFEPPETFQERAPESRTVLASPEVLVKVAAPIRVAAFDGVDELGEPDIRIKQTRLSRALVMLIGLTVAIMVVVYSSFGRMVSDHRDAAHAQTKVLTRACVAYERRNGEFPETLDKLLAQDPFGVVFFDV